MNDNINKIFEGTHIQKIVAKKTLNKNWKIIQLQVECFFSEMFGKEWKDVNEITIFPANIYSEFESETDLTKIVSGTKAISLLFILDDVMEKEPQMCDHWTRLYRSSENPNYNSDLERAFASVVKDLKTVLSPLQLERYLEMMATFFETSKTVALLESGKIKLSKQEYLNFRNIQGVCEILALFLENLVDIEISGESLKNPLIKEYHRLFGNHIIIINDLFSWNREKSMNDPMNYINIFKTENESEEYLINELKVELQNVEEKMLSLKTEIMANITNFSEQYLNSLFHVMYGNYRWSQLCKKYNEDYFQDS